MEKEGKFNLVYTSLVFLVCILFAGVAVAAPTFNVSGTNSSLSEDQLPIFEYNFTKNVTNAAGETLFFRFENITVSPDLGFTIPSNYSWIFINSSTGVMTINATRNNQTGNFSIHVYVGGSSGGESRWFYFFANATNDAPVFSNLTNQSFNVSINNEVWQYLVQVTDEENNIPFSLNISFINCTTATWSTRNSSNCTLFNSSQYSFNPLTGLLNISFIPSRNDVGNYSINFTVIDLNNNITPYNASTTVIVNFSVLNINNYPIFIYACNNERNTTEDSIFNCWINVSDGDELNNITFLANYSWFTFNGTTLSNYTVINTVGGNASALVNFTATDLSVGNWSVTIKINDTGSPRFGNSTSFWFFVGNKNDSVNLSSISNISVYTTSNYTVYINASDDDLLIPDKRVYNESLTFSSNESFVNISTYSIVGNVTIARIEINPNFPGVATGNHSVNISVIDANNYSIDSKVFLVTILINSPPVWDSSIIRNYSINESLNFYLNLTANVSDSNNDNITFSFSNFSAFPSFNLSSLAGIINFAPEDADVGYHFIIINASDGKVNASLSFNFTILNIPDSPVIDKLTSVVNAIIDANSNVNTTEDNATKISLYVRDEDFKIPAAQKIYYNESLTLITSIQGKNATLLNFSLATIQSESNLSIYEAYFTPSKYDVGNYNITINVTDRSGLNSSITFNLTVSAISHKPIFLNIINLTSSINRTFYYKFNVSDTELGNSWSSINRNFTFNYSMISGPSIFNATTFNTTSGVINVTFNDSSAGRYQLNVTIFSNKSEQNYSSTYFWIYVYNSPVINFPNSSYQFNFSEGNNSNLSLFVVNHSISDNLTYFFYINNALRYNTTYYGNNTNLTWSFTPSYSDETYGRFQNLTLVVINPIYADLNTSANWSVNITHANAPVNFSGAIGDSSAEYTQSITINLTNYFLDIDHTDTYYNQTVNFTVNSNASAISSSISSAWILTLTTTSTSLFSETLNITANDSSSSARSNNFVVSFTTPSTTPATTTVSSGGGGTPAILKLILPDPVSAVKGEKIVLPIQLYNAGQTSLNGITLGNSVAKNGVIRKDFASSFDRTQIPSLDVGQRENVTLTIEINTDELGVYEININAKVASPSFTDWGKIYLTVKEGTKLEEKILFTEELIASNPECAEIKELVNEARKYAANNDFAQANAKIEEAVMACKNAISQKPNAKSSPEIQTVLFNYAGLASIGALTLGFVYYFYKRIKLRRALIISS